MKEIKTANYKKIAQTDKGIGDMFGGIGQGYQDIKNQRYMSYAKQVIDLINQGVPQQEAFDKIMTQNGIGKTMQVLRQGVIDAVKQLYNQQQPQQPAFEKTYDQQYPTPSIPQNRQIPAQ